MILKAEQNPESASSPKQQPLGRGLTSGRRKRELAVIAVTLMVGALAVAAGGRVLLRVRYKGAESFALPSLATDRPLRIQPTTSRVFSPDPAAMEAVLERLKPGADANLSMLQHALHMFGRNASVSGRETGEPTSIVELLLDPQESAGHFGGAHTLTKTRFGARFPEYVEWMIGTEQPTTEGHPGETLAVLAGVGVPLSHPIGLPGDDASTLQAVLEDTVANFTLEGEIYWQAAALALYLPPVKTWKNKFGNRFSFDDLARELLERHFSHSSCARTHGLITLTTLLRADEQEPVLSHRVRREVREHLRRVANTLVEIQSPEGWWPMDWYRAVQGDELAPVPRPLPIAPAMLSTGHHLEWLMLLPDELRPSDEVFRKVAAVSDAEGLAVLGGAYCGIETRQVEYACGYTDPPDPQECEMIPGLGPVDSGEWNVGNQNRTCYAGAMECSTQSLPVYRWAATCD